MNTDDMMTSVYYENQYSQNIINNCKRILFSMWKDVEDGVIGSRSMYADKSLELCSALYDKGSIDDNFYKEYELFVTRNKTTKGQQND